MVVSPPSMDSSTKHSSLPCLCSKKPSPLYSLVPPISSTMENPPLLETPTSSISSVLPPISTMKDHSFPSPHKVSSDGVISILKANDSIKCKSGSNKGGHLSSKPKLVLNKSLNHGGAGHSSLNLVAVAEAKGVLPSNNGGLEDSNFVASFKNMLGKMNGTADQGNRSKKPDLGNPRNSTSAAILGTNGGLEDSNFVSPFKNVLGKMNGTTNQAILGNNRGLEDSNSIAPFKNVLGKMNGTTNQGNGAHRPDQLHHVPFSSFGNIEKPASKGEACPSINVKGQKVQLVEVSSLRNSELPHNKGIYITLSLVNKDANNVVGQMPPIISEKLFLIVMC
ncbi:hypothetical protein LWI29_002949 [Acer saccharum]|uniref:Uncharacterized protein n=1 Tax=Acer saccharum TaxID=4024 RepID=A0AA39S9U3_ACESA|nr:hypothetical protein LWI29_002949 [Acer saccharum]